MKNLKLILFLGILLLSNINKGYTMQSMMGNTNLSDNTYDSLKIMGAAKLSNVIITENLDILGPTTLTNNSKIEGKINVVGPINLRSVTLNTGRVVGPFDAENLKVSGELNIVGTVDCNNCKFKSPLVITSKKCSFKDSEMESLRILKDGEKATQKIYLRGKTTVHGDIICEGKNVEIVLDEGAKVLGNVTKGK
ncbi:MAG: hypothetical protein HQK51_15240 [Oligoflexia bacterium]|nr:hypothetical protein [Oligoflexia bacterium]